MICGSMGTQPFYQKEYGAYKYPGNLNMPNVSIIDKYGFYVPNHPHLTKKELFKIINIVNEGFKK